MSAPVLDTWKCPRRCGWFRTFNVDQKHADEEIQHPLYGWVRNAIAAQRDIAAHDCWTYTEARRRLHD